MPFMVGRSELRGRRGCGDGTYHIILIALFYNVQNSHAPHCLYHTLDCQGLEHSFNEASECAVSLTTNPQVDVLNTTSPLMKPP